MTHFITRARQTGVAINYRNNGPCRWLGVHFNYTPVRWEEGIDWFMGLIMRGSECRGLVRNYKGTDEEIQKGGVVMEAGVITSFLIHILSLSSPTRPLFQEHFEFVSPWLPTQTFSLWHPLDFQRQRQQATFFFFFFSVHVVVFFEDDHVKINSLLCLVLPHWCDPKSCYCIASFVFSMLSVSRSS